MSWTIYVTEVSAADEARQYPSSLVYWTYWKNVRTRQEALALLPAIPKHNRRYRINRVGRGTSMHGVTWKQGDL